MDIRVIFSPSVNDSIERFLDYVEIDALGDALNFIEELQNRLVQTLSTFPEGCPVFQGDTRYFSVRGYTFLYEYDAAKKLVTVLDMYGRGQDWR